MKTLMEEELAVENARFYVMTLVRSGNASQEALDAAFAAWRKASDACHDAAVAAQRKRAS
jgi:hypothetical protein